MQTEGNLAMRDYSALVATLTRIPANTDNGSGPPPPITSHEADRRAGHAVPERATDPAGARLSRLRLGRRPSHG